MVVAVAVPAGLLAVLAAGAASLPTRTAGVGTAASSVARCTTAGLPLVQNLSGSSVVSVTMSGLPTACGGATLDVAVNNGTTSSSGSAAIPSAGGSVTVTLAAAVTAAGIEQIDAVVVGP